MLPARNGTHRISGTDPIDPDQVLLSVSGPCFSVHLSHGYLSPNPVITTDVISSDDRSPVRCSLTISIINREETSSFSGRQ